MTLTPEWRDRIDAWREELPRQFYEPLGEVPLEGYTTTEQLRLEEALDGPFRPMPEGTAWGAKWEYAWFRGSLTLPDAAKGRRIALRPQAGGESVVYVNGAAAGAQDRQHSEITLARSGSPGERYDIAIETYAGHGPRVAHAGPIPPGRETVPEPPPAQTTVGCTTFGVWHEEVYQLWADVEALYGIRESLDPDSLRVAEIDAGLRDFALIVDFEQPREAFLETVACARERLRPLLEAKNGSTTPVLYGFGHAHIDVAWLWPLEETEHKCVRTFATQMALAEEYPEYRFLQSEPHVYWMMQTHYPEMYARVKEAVDKGIFVPEGGMWVEADTNISSGESLIRQFLFGKRFFREEFGVDNEILWLPDVFGYSGALPQIMRGCGVPYFATAKIFWAYHGGQPFPYNTFTWEGIDGSEVKVHLMNDYNSRTDTATLIERWNGRVQKDGIATRLLPFGFGDGGGGATRNHLEFVRRAADLEGVPKVVIASPLDYFKDQEERGWPAERFVGELYFQAHRGTYTSQARTKRGNRKSEFALREAEMWATAAGALAGFAIPQEALFAAWRDVLLNQFHDIIPGSSIHRVYEEAEEAYARVIDSAGQVASAAAEALAEGQDGLTVFNSLGWPRPVVAPLPAGWRGAADVNGQSLPVQTEGDVAYAEVTVPACGWTSLDEAAPQAPENVFAVSDTLLENDLLRVELNGVGEFVRILDKETDRDWAAEPGNSLRMFQDIPSRWDAWDIDSLYALKPAPLDDKATVTVTARGPLFAELTVERTLLRSPMTQRIRLYRGSRRIECHTEIDWQESHKMLKVAFPVTVHANEAVHEIQFGHIRRPNHASMPYDADRFEVSNHKWTALVEEGRGCAVLNDSKYGVNVVGNTILLTLLKSPLAPDMTADKGRQEFTYAFCPWNGPLATSAVVREGYELNVDPLVVAGRASGQHSLLSVDAENVVIETVKPAEDASGDVIVRLYEAKRTATRCTLSTSLALAAVEETDMLENALGTLPVSEGAVALDLRPFEVKTIRLRLS
ncbi:MAG: alpha-mannosidase [Chloroflexi bacterium]|nr:alpha-mannosidase [Chloroflexota bacterium]